MASEDNTRDTVLELFDILTVVDTQICTGD